MPQSVTGVRLWSDTLDKLRELQALVTLSTGKRVNMTELVHRLVTDEMERIQQEKTKMKSATLHLTNRRTRWIQLTEDEANERQAVNDLDDAFAQMSATGVWLSKVCDRNGLNKEEVERVELHD